MTTWTRLRGFIVRSTRLEINSLNWPSTARSRGPALSGVQRGRGTWTACYGTKLDVESGFGDEFFASGDFDWPGYGDEDFCAVYVSLGASWGWGGGTGGPCCGTVCPGEGERGNWRGE
jgi:hypothetical protein